MKRAHLLGPCADRLARRGACVVAWTALCVASACSEGGSPPSASPDAMLLPGDAAAGSSGGGGCAGASCATAGSTARDASSTQSAECDGAAACDGGGGTDAGGSTPDGLCAADGACEEAVALLPALHMEGDIAYSPSPPAGGPHNGCWADYGVHDALLPEERWVHNLEHGAVVFLHDCPDGCDDELSQLAELVRARPLALMTAYPEMDARFAVVAWGYRLLTSVLDLAAFEAFYDSHVDHAPESVPSGAPAGCP